MYGQLNKVLRSKLALWGITVCAIVLFCMTAVITSGMNARKQSAANPPAEKIPSIQSAVSALPVQNSGVGGVGATTQLQGQSGNGDVSQPAAAASVAPNAGLDSGIAATQVQATGNTGSAASVSASLQPSPTNTGVQMQVNAAGLNLGIEATLP